MAKIARTRQRPLVASSIAFIVMAAAAVMMPATSNAHGGGGHHGGGFRFHGPRNVGLLGFTHPHTSPSPGLSIARRFPNRKTAFRHSRVIGAPFFPLGVDGVWIDNSGSTPMVVVTQPSLILQQQQPVPAPAVVKTPSAAEPGIIVVRGDSKSYVTFPSG